MRCHDLARQLGGGALFRQLDVGMARQADCGATQREVAIGAKANQAEQQNRRCSECFGRDWQIVDQARQSADVSRAGADTFSDRELQQAPEQSWQTP